MSKVNLQQFLYNNFIVSETPKDIENWTYTLRVNFYRKNMTQLQYLEDSDEQENIDDKEFILCILFIRSYK